MKLEQQLLINMEWSSNEKYGSTGNEVRTTTTDQQGMKLERQLLINRDEVITTTTNQQGMKLEQQLLINMEWSYNHNYWSTGNEVDKTPIDQRGMKMEQHILINREWR